MGLLLGFLLDPLEIFNLLVVMEMEQVGSDSSEADLGMLREDIRLVIFPRFYLPEGRLGLRVLRD